MQGRLPAYGDPQSSARKRRKLVPLLGSRMSLPIRSLLLSGTPRSGIAAKVLRAESRPQIESMRGTRCDRLLGAMSERPWYGNVHELKNAIEHAAVVARGRPITEGDLPVAQQYAIREGESSDALHQAITHWLQSQATDQQLVGLHNNILAEVEPVLFQFALKQTGGKSSQGGRAARSPSRYVAR